MVFVPIQEAELAAISGKTALTDCLAHRVTPELLAALGYDEAQQEEAEHAAMLLASIAALSYYGARLVLVAEVAADLVSPAPESANGQCRISRIDAEAIIAYFTEDPNTDVAQAAAAARGLSIDEAWEQAAVQELLLHDLLWNDVTEYVG